MSVYNRRRVHAQVRKITLRLFFHLPGSTRLVYMIITVLLLLCVGARAQM